MHTINTTGDEYGQIWEMYFAPWNRPQYRDSGNIARVHANLLPGCMWPLFNSHGYAGAQSPTDGGTNELGVGGALYINQSDPKYYIPSTNARTGNVTNSLPMSQALPTYSRYGRDDTEWQCFVSLLVRLKGPDKDVKFVYNMKLFYEFSVGKTCPGSRHQRTHAGLSPSTTTGLFLNL